MTLALVMGGGGITGIAWETGLHKGLRDGGVDLDQMHEPQAAPALDPVRRHSAARAGLAEAASAADVLAAVWELGR